MNSSESKTARDDSIVLSPRPAGLIMAVFLFSLFIAFMIGYFFGTKHATDEFVQQIRQEVLADQLLAAAYATHNNTISHCSVTLHNADLESASPETSTIALFDTNNNNDVASTVILE